MVSEQQIKNTYFNDMSLLFNCLDLNVLRHQRTTPKR